MNTNESNNAYIDMCLNKCVSTIYANYVPTPDILLYKHMYGHLCSC